VPQGSAAKAIDEIGKLLNQGALHCRVSCRQSAIRWPGDEEFDRQKCLCEKL